MTRWYRAYEGTVTDPKLAEAAMVAECSRSVAVAAWHLLLENAAAVNDGGRIDIPTRRIAAALCEPLAVVETLVSAFAAIGLIVDAHVAAWKRRQYESDNSTMRSRKHREMKKTAETLPTDVDATLQERCATPPKTETETEVPLATANGRSPSLSAADMTKAIFDSGVSLIVASGRDERQARSIIGRLRKNHHDSVVLAILGRCPSNISDPVEWLTKAAESETNGRQNQNPAKPTTRQIGERVAARLAGAGHRGTDSLPSLGPPRGYATG